MRDPVTHINKPGRAFLNAVVAKYGDKVGEQALNVLEGNPIKDQNLNTMKLLVPLAKKWDQEDLAEEIEDFLAKGGGR